MYFYQLSTTTPIAGSTANICTRKSHDFTTPDRHNSSQRLIVALSNEVSETVVSYWFASFGRLTESAAELGFTTILSSFFPEHEVSILSNAAIYIDLCWVEMVKGQSTWQAQQLGAVWQSDVRQTVQRGAELQVDHSGRRLRTTQDSRLVGACRTQRTAGQRSVIINGLYVNS